MLEDLYITIDNKKIGPGEKTYIIAEMSANHNQDFNRAVKIIEAAKEAGADAVKLQTYTPDTLTIDCHNEYFQIGKGTIWEGKTLYQLYREAYMPWEWQPKLKKTAYELGITLFSTAYDETSVLFLEEMDVPAFKIASFELNDLPLLKTIARTGKPIILSTGMATLKEIEEAIQTIQDEGNNKIILLKCTSAYPALPEEMNLKTIPFMYEKSKKPTGLSDHTLGSSIAVAAVALGACVIEKHFTLSRADGGADSSFSLEPEEFKNMVQAIRTTEKALGKETFDITAKQEASLNFRRSLFAVSDIKAGELFTLQNIRSIRPSHGLHTRYLDEIIGRRAVKDIERGTPLSWEVIS